MLTSTDWTLFLKSMAALTNPDVIRMELWAACSTDVNKMLLQFVGPIILDACSEDELLGHKCWAINSIVVKQIHHEVHQKNFHLMQ